MGELGVPEFLHSRECQQLKSVAWVTHQSSNSHPSSQPCPAASDEATQGQGCAEDAGEEQ